MCEKVKRVLVCTCVFLIIVTASLDAATITYTDKIGRVVTVPLPVNRAVLFPIADLIPALGIWDKVVGISRSSFDNDLIMAIKPHDAKTFPDIGRSSDLNIEALLKLKPDIVFITAYNPDTVRFMEERGLRVIAIYLESLSELYDVMRLHGKLFGKEEKMERSIAKMEGILELIKERVSKIPNSKKKKVLWLNAKPTSVAGGSGVTNDIFNLIGGINSASKIPLSNTDVSMEQIVLWNADVIFIWGNAAYTEKDILTNPQWRHIKAAREGRVYKSPEWSTWSPRLAPIALWMAMKTYPEYFRDIDFEKITDDFYRSVFGIPYRKVKRIEG